MSDLATLDFTSIVRNMVAAIQGGSSQLLNLTVGSVLRAIVEAQAAVILWLQGLVTYVLTLTRFSTSVGADADSWAADFGFFREPAVPATGEVTFTRFTTTTQSVIPVGALLQSADGTQTFTVNLDTSHPAYNPGLGGYVLAPTVVSLSVSVTAATPGSSGNVLANSITSMGQGIPGVDTVTNGSAYINGRDAETDAGFKSRFLLFIAGLSKATKAAVASAIANVQQGLQYTLTENFQYDGTYDPGSFYVVIDNGSGDPSDQILADVGTGIEVVRALGIRFAVFPPVVIDVDVSMTITSAPGYDHAAVVGQVGLALESFVNNLGLGNGLPYTKLPAVAFEIPGVTNVTAVLLNGGTADIAGNTKNTLKSDVISVA